MSNKYAIFIFLLLVSCYTYSQKGFKGAIFAGPLTSQVDGDNHAGYSKFGINGGISVNFLFNDSWSFNTEITYISKGSVKNDAKEGIYYRLKLHYIEIPLYITYRSNRKKLKKYSFDLGGTIGYLFKAAEDKDGYGDLDPDPEMNNFDYNALAGVNWHINDYWKLGVRFQYSILPIRNVQGNPFKDVFNRGQYNNLFALNIFRYF